MNIDKFMISYKTRIDYIIREAMNCFYPYRHQVDFKSHGYNGYTITYSYHGISFDNAAEEIAAIFVGPKVDTGFSISVDPNERERLFKIKMLKDDDSIRSMVIGLRASYPNVRSKSTLDIYLNEIKSVAIDVGICSTDNADFFAKDVIEKGILPEARKLVATRFKEKNDGFLKKIARAIGDLL